jgi:hypothetical protein
MRRIHLMDTGRARVQALDDAKNLRRLRVPMKIDAEVMEKQLRHGYYNVRHQLPLAARIDYHG